MSYLNWHVGMKVECLDALAFDIRYHGPDEQLPVIGCIYTIREIGRHHPKHPECVTIRLVECVNRPWPRNECAFPIELFFYAQDYRPVQKRATDISIFTAMLTTTKKGVDA
jgi:hypothetical protein